MDKCHAKRKIDISLDQFLQAKLKQYRSVLQVGITSRRSVFPGPAPRAILRQKDAPLPAAPACCFPALLLTVASARRMRTKKTAPDIHRARLSVVIRLGFEPKTHSLEGCCSIQLSYRTDPYVALLVLPWESKADAKITLFLQKHKIIFPKALPLLFSRFFRWPYF